MPRNEEVIEKNREQIDFSLLRVRFNPELSIGYPPKMQIIHSHNNLKASGFVAVHLVSRSSVLQFLLL